MSYSTEQGVSDRLLTVHRDSSTPGLVSAGSICFALYFASCIFDCKLVPFAVTVELLLYTLLLFVSHKTFEMTHSVIPA